MGFMVSMFEKVFSGFLVVFEVLVVVKYVGILVKIG